MLNNKIPRKNFIKVLSILTTSAFCPPALYANASQQDGESILKCSIYLQAPKQTQITIRWLTTMPVYSWVEYGEDPAQMNNHQHQSNDGLVNANNTTQAITIAGLKPGTTYYYRICSKIIIEFKPYKITYGDIFMSEGFSFKTLKKDVSESEIWVLNDIHDRPNSFEQLFKFHEKTCDFIFLNGDMFNWQKDEQQLIDHLINPLVEASGKTIPFILSRGNHETRGIFARGLHNYFNDVAEKYYYSFTHGAMYIIVLDSGEDKVDENEEYGGIVDFDAYREQQKIWLQNEIKKKEFKKAKYKIVFSHIPLFYAGSAHGTQHCHDLWAPILRCAKIDVLISGHTHVYGMHAPVAGKHNYPVIIGGGPLDGHRTLIKIKTTQQNLIITAFNDEGKELDSIQL